MYIFLHFLWMEQHLLVVEEERRRIVVLKNSLQKIYNRMLIEMNPNLQIVSECLGAICRLEESITWRCSFLEIMIDDFRNAYDSIGEILDKLTYQS